MGVSSGSRTMIWKKSLILMPNGTGRNWSGGGSVLRFCGNCGEKVYRRPSQANRTKVSYCNSQCFANSRKKIKDEDMPKIIKILDSCDDKWVMYVKLAKESDISEVTLIKRVRRYRAEQRRLSKLWKQRKYRSVAQLRLEHCSDKAEVEGSIPSIPIPEMEGRKRVQECGNCNKYKRKNKYYGVCLFFRLVQYRTDTCVGKITAFVKAQG